MVGRVKASKHTLSKHIRRRKLSEKISNYGHVLLSHTQTKRAELVNGVNGIERTLHAHHFLQTTIIASMPIMVNKMARIGSVAQ